MKKVREMAGSKMKTRCCTRILIWKLSQVHRMRLLESLGLERLLCLICCWEFTIPWKVKWQLMIRTYQILLLSHLESISVWFHKMALCLTIQFYSICSMAILMPPLRKSKKLLRNAKFMIKLFKWSKGIKLKLGTLVEWSQEEKGREYLLPELFWKKMLKYSCLMKPLVIWIQKPKKISLMNSKSFSRAKR